MASMVRRGIAVAGFKEVMEAKDEPGVEQTAPSPEGQGQAGAETLEANATQTSGAPAATPAVEAAPQGPAEKVAAPAQPAVAPVQQ